MSDLPADPALPWERQDGESATQFSMFVGYRDAPPVERSLRKHAEQIGKSFSYVQTTSTQQHWISRCEAWDAEQDRIKREAFAQETARMGQRHAAQARDFATALSRPAEVLVARLGNEKDPIHAELRDMPAKEIISLVRSAAAVFPAIMGTERVARGHASVQVDDDRRPSSGVIMVGGMTSERAFEVWAALERAGIAPRTPTE